MKKASEEELWKKSYGKIGSRQKFKSIEVSAEARAYSPQGPLLAKAGDELPNSPTLHQ